MKLEYQSGSTTFSIEVEPYEYIYLANQPHIKNAVKRLLDILEKTLPQLGKLLMLQASKKMRDLVKSEATESD